MCSAGTELLGLGGSPARVTTSWSVHLLTESLILLADKEIACGPGHMVTLERGSEL